MYSVGGFSFKHSTDVSQLGHLQSWLNISLEQWILIVPVYSTTRALNEGCTIYHLETTLMLHLSIIITTIITPKTTTTAAAAALAVISLLLLLFLLT
jgi:hypothetical protein